MPKNIKIGFFAIGGIVVILACIGYLYYPLAYNQGLYHYQGLVLKSGGIPYNDFIEKKGPMGLLFYGLAAIFFGSSPVAYRLFDLLVQASVAFLLYRIFKKRTSTLVSLAVPFIWLSHILVEGPGNTGDVTNLITLCLVLTYYLLTEYDRTKEWLAGVLMAAACWVKPTAVIMFLPVWYVIYMNHRDEGIQQFIRSALKVLAGGVGVSVGFIAYLFISNSWQGFWEVVVLDPLLNYVDDRNRVGLRLIKRLGGNVVSDLAIRFLGAIGLVIAFKKHKSAQLALLFALSIFLSIILEGKFFPYHFTPLWPFMAVGLYHLIEVTQEKFSWKPLPVAAITLLLLIIPLVPVGLKFQKAGFFAGSDAFQPEKLYKFKDFEALYIGRQPVISYLKQEKAADQTIYALGIDPNIYIDLGTTTDCRMIRDAVMLTVDMQPVDPPPYLKAWEEELMSFLEVEKPDWLLFDNELPTGDFTPAYQNRIDAVLKSYGEGKVLGRYTLYRKL